MRIYQRIKIKDSFTSSSKTYGKSSWTHNFSTPINLRYPLVRHNYLGKVWKRSFHKSPRIALDEFDENGQSRIPVPLEPIVKVFATTTYPNYFLPWQMKASREVTGSGFVTKTEDGKRCILTNAHVVANQTFVSVRKFGKDPTKYTAKVLASGHDCDIAMLHVEDETFWEELPSFVLGSVPELQDEVTVIGYPTGGDNISITTGVVSRIELGQYAHGATNLLLVQIDAAINSGNSGGPVLLDDQVVGIAFQNLPTAENIGYIIPTPIIKHFMKDIALHGTYTGFPALGVQFQTMENSQLREFFRMQHGQTGVLITFISPLSKALQLQPDDILLSMDRVNVGNDGTVAFRNRGERISLDYVLTKKYVGDTCRLKILRKGKELEMDVSTVPRDLLVPVQAYDSRPSYFVHGGLVFSRLVQPYLHEYGEDWYNISPRKLSYVALYGEKQFQEQEVVILCHVLVDEINYGYSNLTNLEVKKCNGVEIRNLRHLVELVENNKYPFLRFDLDEHMVIIMDATKAAAANDRIMKRHYVPSTKSEDLFLPPNNRTGFGGSYIKQAPGLSKTFMI